MATISSQHLALLQSHETQSLVELWLGPSRGDLDEATITAGWLPTTGEGWTDKSATVLLSEGLNIAHDGRGYTGTCTVADHSKLAWADDLAVAVVSQHWDGSEWTDRTLDAWGYLAGDERDRLADGDQAAVRTFTYAGYWERTNIPAHRFGRRNLAQGATVAGATAALASVTAEAGVEYISQEDNAASKAIDGNADTVYIADVIADPERPALGDSTEVHIVRAYAGRTTRSIGAGNEPIWIELGYVHAVATWLAMSNPAAVPNLADLGSNVRDDGAVVSSFVDSPEYGKLYQVRCLTGQGSPTVRNGVQWNVPLGLPRRGAKLVLAFKATSTESIGRRILVTFKPTDPGAAGKSQTLSLDQGWREYELDLDDLTNYGGFVLRLQNEAGEVATQDLYFGFRASVYVGYSDLYSGAQKLHLSYDDGAGHVDTLRIAWDVAAGVEDWRIPPLGTVILADDAATFRAKFDPGNRQVCQLRNLAPEWFFGPGVGKLALRRGSGFKFQQYAPAGYSLVEEIDFTANGLSWTPQQGVSRQSPVGTGALAVEEYPHVGLETGAYGAAFLWLDLGAYEPTVLALPLTSTQLTLAVEDGDRLTVGQESVIGGERVLIGARTDNSFVSARGQGGTTATAHDAGDAVTPRVAGATQTGPQWDAVEIRRKPGTPPILAGAVITSNLASPGDPSVGGSLWERHPDWTLAGRFEHTSGADVIVVRVPEGVRQARHVCLVIDRMARLGGVPQRAKVNEIVVREWLPGGNAAGGWAGHTASDAAGVAAHLLTQHGGVPASKVTVAVSPAPMGDLPVAGATLARALGNLEGDGTSRVWCDPYNAVTVAPDPANPQWDAREPYATLDGAVLLGDLAGSWGVRSPVARVRGTFTETASLRTYVIAYPDVPGVLGEVVEIRGTVRSWAEGRDRCEREYRLRNARRAPQSATIGPAPWVRPGLRVVYDSAALDAGGQWVGVNAVIRSFRHEFREGPTGGCICTCTLDLTEIVL